ncbi:LysR family transcriptional regulator [Vibrio porteresiae]|uniref:LysR family transcriptional regulator n=1 Tax=Vibrio porteresiae DSM 19223 TaxID=1123496 RepID=A0ABZ0QHV5_9VIBR|nr:LysR family transcriptional regulator [Vibrio porteresiae]WPC75390.1 LysR family transcriptional regulator [Vibrio porteresiae DSM 19223]
MDRLTAVEVFIEIAEVGSLTKAAEKLGMSTAMVSRYLSSMEEWFGTRLLHRTTRKISLTEAGFATLPQCKEILFSVENARNIAQEHSNTPSGVLRVAASGTFSDAQLGMALVDFQHLYPNIDIVLHVGHHLDSLVDDRIDLAIRITNTLDESLIARPLAKCYSVLCAAPKYIRKHGVPRNLEDLRNHYCITNSSGFHRNYRFIRGKDVIEIPINPHFQSNETNAICRAVLSGAGIGMLPTFYINERITNGDLVPLLPHEQPEVLGIHAVYLSRQYQPLKLRLLVDFLVSRFGGDIAPWDK